jgi:hypothetical protein
MNKLLQDHGFRFHLMAYIIVNVILIVVNVLHPSHWWFYWPLIGWGIGLAAHGYAVSRGPTRRGPTRPSPGR